MTDRTFEGRIALVTGASRGLGRALARELGADGAQVIGLARTVGALEELDEEIRAAGGLPATLVPLDLAKAEDAELERLAAAILERWGRLDLWANTAVVAPPLAPVEHIGAADLDRALAVNTRAVQRLIRVLDPALRRSDAGRVLHFPDVAGSARPNHAAYLASKAAGSMLLEAWGQSVERASAVQVREVLAPPMATALRRRFHPGEDASTLVDPPVIAARLVAHLGADLPGTIDLRN